MSQDNEQSRVAVLHGASVARKRRLAPRAGHRETRCDAHEAARAIATLVTDARKKNPAAVALGRLGGLKGGKARAAKLSAARRSEIAEKAANYRWGKKQK